MIETRVQKLPGGERRWLHAANEALGMVALIVATSTVQLSVILVRSSQSSALSRLLSTLVALMLTSTLMNAGRLNAQRGPPPP